MIPSDAEESRLLVHAYSDGELDPVNALEIERRIAADPRLAAEYRQVETVKQLLRERLPREELPRAWKRANRIATNSRCIAPWPCKRRMCQV